MGLRWGLPYDNHSSSPRLDRCWVGRSSQLATLSTVSVPAGTIAITRSVRRRCTEEVEGLQGTERFKQARGQPP